MASANVTLGGNGYEFEVDTNQKTATLNQPGGFLRNTHATEIAYVNYDAATCATSQPVGVGGRTIKAGQISAVPRACTSFTFKAGASTYLQYSVESPVT